MSMIYENELITKIENGIVEIEIIFMNDHKDFLNFKFKLENNDEILHFLKFNQNLQKNTDCYISIINQHKNIDISCEDNFLTINEDNMCFTIYMNEGLKDLFEKIKNEILNDKTNL